MSEKKKRKEEKEEEEEEKERIPIGNCVFRLYPCAYIHMRR